MEFLYFLIRRVFWSLLVLIGLSIVIFTIARVMPGDPARLAMGPRASQEQVDGLRSKMGLDKPLLEQYRHFIVGLSRGDLGLSFLTKRPVNDDIAETFAATFELVLSTIAIAFLAGIPLGVVAAANKDGWVDNLVRLIAILGAVTPSFLLALLLQVFAGYVLHILPTTGRTLGASPFHILFRELLPNCASAILVKASLDFGFVILIGAALSFLGLGVQPPTPDLGAMVANGADFLPERWWESLLPGAAILFAALGFNLLGDGLRDLFDVESVR